METQDALCPHPFVHRLTLSRTQRLRGLLLGLLLFPLRLLLASLLFLVMWPLARLRLAGLSPERRRRPASGWRRWLLHLPVLLLSRAVFFCLGFLWVRVKGRRADLKEAPILTVAPHSSFLDMLVLCPAQLATVVSRSENCSLPVIGALLEFNQSVLVSRKDPESRRNAVTQITERVTSNGYWPQMLMFPEGTTTNGKTLIKFKPGAFLAGVPVQPVLLHYPNKLDTVRWTYKGTTWMETLWYTTSQLYTNVTVEFLPVYRPSEQEKNDPMLYAENVQKLMAHALRVPATDYVMEGRVPVRKLDGLSLALDPPAREMLTLLRSAGFGASEVEAMLGRVIDRCRSGAERWKANAYELACLLGQVEGQLEGRTATKICGLFSKDELVDLRQVYLSIAVVSGVVTFQSLLHTAFSLFDVEGRGSLDAAALSGLMGALLGVAQQDTRQLHAAASRDGRVTEEDLLAVLTTHPTFHRVVHEYLQPEGAVLQLPNRKSVSNNGSRHNENGALPANKKAD